ncbi:T9SS type A sorting domain-containing protein [Polaribacter sp. Asnod6-C07]|uniref:T9SS type A sorting domain-containing protein n=1 Tax=Polaribacter sp. Asnod6-C07 TaxID=3160582 RepID=UPI00386E5555
MKKNYFFTLLLTFSFTLLSFGQDFLITGVIDGPLPGGFPKGFELYAVNDISDLSIYGLESTTNGADAAGEEYTFPNDNISAGTYIYLGNTGSSAGFTQYLGVTPQYEDGVASVNGDDTIILYKNGTIVDLLGRIGEDGSNTDWDHLDGWAYRDSGKGPSTTFDASEWTFSGVNALDGCDKSDDTGTNGECGSVFPVGTYSEIASTTPTITVTGSTSSFDYFEGYGPSEEQTVVISGENLTDNINLQMPANFEVSLSSGTGFGSSASIPQTGGIASATVYLRLAAGLSVNTYTGDAVASSAGAVNNTGTLTGVVSPADPQFYYTAYLDDFNYSIADGLPSAEQTFTVEALFLLGDLKVTAPTNFEVSLTTGSGFDSSVTLTPNSGSIDETTIYMRLKAGLSEGNYTGDVLITSITVDDKSFSVVGNSYGANTNSLVISGIYDGSLSGGTPKGVEIYVLKDISDLSVYGVSSVTNGQGSTAGNVEFSFPDDAVTAGTFIYISTEETNFNAFFGMNPTYTSGVLTINGDDAIELYENGQIIDVYGDVNNDFSGEAYDYLDGWAYRKSNTGPEGTTFTSSNWTYSGVDGLEEGTNNATATTPFPLGTYNVTASVKNNQIEGFATYPNPVKNSRFTITTNSTDKKEVAIFNVLGKQVLSTSFSATKSNIDVSSIASGLYILKVTEGTKIATSKLVIK